VAPKNGRTNSHKRDLFLSKYDRPSVDRYFRMSSTAVYPSQFSDWDQWLLTSGDINPQKRSAAVVLPNGFPAKPVQGAYNRR
jgi:hypothetical protein